MAPAGPPRLFKSPRARRAFLVHLLVAVVAVAGLVVLARRELGFLFSASEARAFVAGFGLWAPVALIALQAAQVVVAPVPGQVLAVVAGYLFGPWYGTLYNMIGITIGSAAAFWLGRRYGRAYVERIVHPDSLERFDGIGDHHALASLFILFLIPGLPDDVLCFVGGLTTVPLRRLVVIAVIGRAPAFFLANVFGDLVGTGERSLAALVLALAIGLSALGYLYRDQVVSALTGDRQVPE